MAEEPSQPTIWVSIGTTVQTRPYENVKIDLGITGIPVGASDEEIAIKLKEADLTFEQVIKGLTNKLWEKVQELR